MSRLIQNMKIMSRKGGNCSMVGCDECLFGLVGGCYMGSFDYSPRHFEDKKLIIDATLRAIGEEQ